jgi:hypothetical protein
MRAFCQHGTSSSSRQLQVVLGQDSIDAMCEFREAFVNIA